MPILVAHRYCLLSNYLYSDLAYNEVSVRVNTVRINLDLQERESIYILVAESHAHESYPLIGEIQ